MFPHTPEAWIFISVACFVGFAIGQWLKSRRRKADKNDQYIEGLKKMILAENRDQTKKNKKKSRKGKSPS